MGNVKMGVEGDRIHVIISPGVHSENRKRKRNGNIQQEDPSNHSSEKLCGKAKRIKVSKGLP
jgi:hypothetical protein